MQTTAEKLTGSDRFTLWISHHYIWIFNIGFLLYAGMPFMAPALMKVGAPRVARAIYFVYSPLCHQLAYRSWFLFGEQAYYPRQLADIPGVLTYEQVSEHRDIEVFYARDFIGNEQIGYKVALCQRDVAIYGMILLFGIAFALTGRRVHPIPWYLWLALGFVPIGIDGVSQLPSLTGGLPSWIILRESTPLLRTITGSLFGLTTAWYLYPYIDESMVSNREIVEEKMKRIAQQKSLPLEGA